MKEVTMAYVAIALAILSLVMNLTWFRKKW